MFMNNTRGASSKKKKKKPKSQTHEFSFVSKRIRNVWLDSSYVQCFCISGVFCGFYVLFTRLIRT